MQSRLFGSLTGSGNVTLWRKEREIGRGVVRSSEELGCEERDEREGRSSGAGGCWQPCSRGWPIPGSSSPGLQRFPGAPWPSQHPGEPHPPLGV